MLGPLPLPGDLVWIRRRRWRVERAQRDRHVIRLDVAARDRRLTFLSPFDRVVTRAHAALPRRVRPQHALARLARLLADADDLRVPSAAVTAAVEILPHQLEPAMAMLAGRSRVLIADEVGLGKTIQAGLIIAELVRRDPGSRVLVLVPAVLREQWTGELERRFGLGCHAADRAGLDAIARAGAFGDNPWRRAGIWLASPDFLKQRHVAESLPRDPWDLVVIDEAHSVCGDSDRYDLCHRLAGRSRRTLLLTATPHGGDETRFQRLLRLGRLDDADDDVTVFHRRRDSIRPRHARRVRWHRVGLAGPEQRALAGLRAFERTVAARARDADQARLLLSVLRKRALSTMSALSQSLTRRLAWLGEPGAEEMMDWTQPRFAFDAGEEDVDGEERDGLTAQTGLNSRQERSWLRRLRLLADEAAGVESKVERLVSLIHRSAEPVVVFTEFRDSLDVIVRRLRFSRPVSVLHGAQDAGERRQQLRQFLEGSTSVLVSTDVGGQGLNLQSRARWVISVELPWNPARLEQRIGRVDRISQTRDTHLTLLVARDEAESGLLLHVSRRIFAARRSFSADALADILPEHDVRAALLPSFAAGHATLRAVTEPQPPPVPLLVCRRWTRPAVRAAAALLRRRALAARWRSADVPSGAIVANRGRAQLLVPQPGHVILVFTVPILSTAETLIERRVVALTVAGGESLAERACHRYQTIAAALRPVITAVVARRIAVAGRFLRRVRRAALGREQAIARARQTEILLDEVEPGLFDLREARAFESRAADDQRAQADSDRRQQELEDDDRGDRVRAGDPVLEIVIERR